MFVFLREFITKHYYPKERLGINPIKRKLPDRAPERLIN